MRQPLLASVCPGNMSQKDSNFLMVNGIYQISIFPFRRFGVRSKAIMRNESSK